MIESFENAAPGAPEDLPAAEPLSENHKKANKNVLIAGGILGGLILIALIMLLVSQLFLDMPARIATKSLRNTLIDISSSAKEMLQKPTSVKVDFDLSKIDGTVSFRSQSGGENAANEGTSFASYPYAGSFTAWSDPKNYRLAYALDLNRGGRSFLDAETNLSIDEAVLSSTALFGETAYGIDLNNLSKTLPGSVLDPEGGSFLSGLLSKVFSCYEDVYEWLCDSRKSPLDGVRNMNEQEEEIAKALFKVFLDALEKHGEWSRVSEKIEIGEKTLRTSRITLKLDGESVAAIIEDVTDWMDDSAEIKKYFSIVRNEYGDLADAANYDLEAYIDKFYDALAEIDPDRIEEALKDVRITLDFYIRGLRLLRTDASLRENDRKISCSLTVGPKPKQPDVISFSFKNNGSDWKLSFNYTVEERTSSRYYARYRLETDSRKYTGTAEWDKKEGGFTVILNDKNSDETREILRLGGHLTKEKNVTTLVAEKLKTSLFGLADLDIRDSGVTVVLDNAAQMPDPPAYTDLLTLDKEDFQDIFEDLKDAWEMLKENVSASGDPSAVPAP